MRSRLNHWDPLRRGDAEQALVSLREIHGRDPSASHTMELGVAYLWVGRYQEASAHFEEAIKKDRFPVSIYYGMAGAAHWCLEQPGAALRVWNRGLDAYFTDGGGGVHLPLLMLVASILRIGAFKKEAEEILRGRLDDPERKGWLKNWPGPLAKFAIGLIDENALLQSCKGSMKQEAHRKWLSEFYLGVMKYGRGILNLTDLKDIMRRTADTSRAEWSEERNFLSLLWSEEFFIARHESSLDTAYWSQLVQGTAPPPWVR